MEVFTSRARNLRADHPVTLWSARAVGANVRVTIKRLLCKFKVNDVLQLPRAMVACSSALPNSLCASLHKSMSSPQANRDVL